MQLVSHSSSSSSSSSSTSSSSHSAGERHSGEQNGMEKFQRMHLHSPHPPPPPSHFKGEKHRHHSPPPPHQQQQQQHFVNKHHHHSTPPLCSLHCEKGKLRVKPPKPSKKVRKLHHKLMKACKLPKGAHHVPPAPEPGFYCADAAYEHRLGCCLHYHGMSMADERPAEERRPPHEVGGGGHGFGHNGHLRPPHEVGIGHHGHLRHSAHPHPRKRHPCVKPEIRHGAVPPMLPSHEVTATPAEPPIEADSPPRAATMLLADEAAHATQAAY